MIILIVIRKDFDIKIGNNIYPRLHVQTVTHKSNRQLLHHTTHLASVNKRNRGLLFYTESCLQWFCAAVNKE